MIEHVIIILSGSSSSPINSLIILGCSSSGPGDLFLFNFIIISLIGSLVNAGWPSGETSFLFSVDVSSKGSHAKVFEKYSDNTSDFSMPLFVICVLSSSLNKSPILSFVWVLDCTYFQNIFGFVFRFVKFLVPLALWHFSFLF